jgi:hypothetical protein
MGFSSFLLLLQANICLISKNLTFIVFRKFEAAEPKGPKAVDTQSAPGPVEMVTGFMLSRRF